MRLIETMTNLTCLVKQFKTARTLNVTCVHPVCSQALGRLAYQVV